MIGVDGFQGSFTKFTKMFLGNHIVGDGVMLCRIFLQTGI